MPGTVKSTYNVIYISLGCTGISNKSGKKNEQFRDQKVTYLQNVKHRSADLSYIICETQMVLKLQSLHFRTDQGLTFNTILKAMRLPGQSKEWLLLLPV